jgi:ribonuclease HII
MHVAHIVEPIVINERRAGGEKITICGVDEAGRGPVLGPLVVAGVLVADERELREMGVRDSKQLTRGRRKELLGKITQVATIETSVISHTDIDHQRASVSLNVMEVEAFASIINRLKPEIAYMDSADVNPIRFGRMVARRLVCSPRIESEHKADERFPVVSAASIVAKEVRDTLMERIGEELGQPVGSGYAHDPITICFLESWLKENGDLPPYTRRSWLTARRMLSLSKISNLSEWMDEQ